MERLKTEKVMLRELYNSSKRVEVAMFGDEGAGIEGVIKTQKRHDKVIQQYKNDRLKVITVGTFISIAVAFIMKFFK